MLVPQVFRILRFALVAGLAASFIPVASLAMDRADYLKALRIADRHVQRQKTLQAESSSALSSALLKSLYGRYYEVGDQWDVAAVEIQSNQNRMTSDPSVLRDTIGPIGIFHYQVTKVKTGSEPEVLIQVTQLSRFGQKVVDPKVRSLTLKMNDKLLESEKSYVLSTANGETVVPFNVTSVSMRSGVSRLEFYPLDVPEVSTADRQDASALPAIPASLQRIADEARAYHPNLSQSSWFEQDDFFGRPVQFLWQHGDPWPSYLRTPQGIAILLGKSLHQEGA